MFYDFVCKNCGFEQEVSVSISKIAEHLQLCDKCYTRMERVFSAPAIDWKAGGGNNSYGQIGGK